MDAQPLGCQKMRSQPSSPSSAAAAAAAAIAAASSMASMMAYAAAASHGPQESTRPLQLPATNELSAHAVGRDDMAAWPTCSCSISSRPHDCHEHPEANQLSEADEQAPATTDDDMSEYDETYQSDDICSDDDEELSSSTDSQDVEETEQDPESSASLSDKDANSDCESDDEETDLDPSIETEINDFYQTFPCSDDYFIFDKIGEGTFSSVYKAIDIKHYRHHNPWCLDHVPAEDRALQLAGRDAISALRLCRQSNCSIVALKRIYQTSSPDRIINEIRILKTLSGHPNIAPMVTALRNSDQVVIVMRYFAHQDFRLFFRDLEIDEIRNYLRALLSGLEFVHSQRLIHRDIKPSNFLFNRKAGTGVIVDFGLAQIEEHKNTGRGAATERQIDAKRLMRQYKVAGVFQEDPRPPVRANRAGTRGFRAPEVLLRVVNQTRAIDIWSVGVILLCIISGKFPFFQSMDDKTALLEIGYIFGRTAMQNAAASCQRTFQTNIPSINERIPFRNLIARFGEGREDILDEDGYDLLERLLDLDPKQRITATEALGHRFLNQATQSTR